VKGIRFFLYAGFVLLLLGLPLLRAPSSYARTPGQLVALLNMRVEAGYDGHFKANTWVPLRITLENSGDALEGEVVVTDDHAAGFINHYVQPVSLAKGARRQVSLFVPAETSSFEVSFRAGQQVLLTATPSTRVMGDTDRLIVVISDPPDSYNFLGDLPIPYGGRNVISLMQMEQMPDHTAALDSIDVLIFNSVDSGLLTERQRHSIEAWVNAGGHLILNGGPGAALAMNGFQALAPAKVSQTLINGSVISLRNYFVSALLEPAAPTITASVSAVALQPQAGARTLAGAAETPLIVRRELGRGLIDQLAFDPALAPLREWPGRTQLFSALLGGRVNIPLIIGPLRDDSNPVEAAGALQAANLPSILLIGGFLIVYVLVIGPLNFLVLRRFKRPVWAWVTVPLLALAFTLFSALTGFRLRGNTPQVHRLSFTMGDASGGEARSYNIIGLFAPRRTEADVDVGVGLASNLAEVRSSRTTTTTTTQRIGDPGQMVGFDIGGSSTQAIYVQTDRSLGPLSGALSFQAKPITATRQSPQIGGEIVNETGQALKDCVLIVGKDYQVLGDLPPNGRLSGQVLLLLGQPQPGMNLRNARLGKDRYYRGFYTTRNIRAARNSGPPNSNTTASTRLPFDLNGDPITNGLVNWKESNRDDLSWQAEYGMVYSLLGEERLSVGAHVACWGDGANAVANANQVQLPNAGYTDRSLQIWRMPVQPYLAQPATQLPPDVFSWNLINSNGVASFDDQGLILEQGQHIVGFTPWLPIRTTSNNAEITIDTLFSANTTLPAQKATQIHAYNWRTQRYQMIVENADMLTSNAVFRGPYLSPSGEVRLRIDVNGDQINLTNLAVSIVVR